MDKLGERVEKLSRLQADTKAEVAEIRGKLNEMEKWIDMAELNKMSGQVHFLTQQTLSIPKMKEDLDAAHSMIRDLKSRPNNQPSQ